MPLPYNAQILRQQDKDRFLLSLMAPPATREALWALFAFNLEIAKTREVVSDTTIGLIRLQWWRDAIGEIYEGKPPREHVLLTPLAAAIKSYDLPRELFDSLIYAREFDLEGVAPADKQGLINYCDFTNTPLNELALKILSSSSFRRRSESNSMPPMDPDLCRDDKNVIKQISINYAVVGLLRALPFMLSQGRVMIPQDMGFDLNDRQRLLEIVEDILSLTNFTVTPQSKFLKRLNKMAMLYAAQIKALKYDVFDPRLTIPPKFLALRLLF